MTASSETADYVVVGAGLTGCVVAYRLAEAGHSVLLLEAGKDPSGNPDVTTPLGGFSLLGGELDWAYKSVPQTSTYDRVHTLNAGRALGGGTTINFGGWLRGDAGDYNAWADLAGGKSWSWEGMLPWFRKSESFFDRKADPRVHRFDGPVHVTSVAGSDPNRKYPLREPIKDAWAELGVVGPNPDQDIGSVAGIAEFHENSRDGQRQPAHLAYPQTEHAGLKVLTGATAARVLFDGDKVASGVELSDDRRFMARKEVVLCAGAFRTPQLLLLSGIGPARDLAAHGIPLVQDLAGVGTNLHDHFALYMAFKLKDPERGLSLGSPKLTDPAFFKGLPCDWVVNELEKPPAVAAAIETEAAVNSFARALLRHPRPLVENFVVYAPADIPGIPMDGSHVASSTMILTPTSRGVVSLASKDPTDPPKIDPRYLDTAVDREVLVHAARRMLQSMLGTKAMADYIEAETPPSGALDLEDLKPLTLRSTDEEILDRIRRTGKQHHHSGGTAAMGTVVDVDGRVFGVQRLRVADASVVPVPVAGHPQVTLYAVAEQMASFILGAA